LEQPLAGFATRRKPSAERAIYETLIATAQRHLKADEELIAEGEH
jgi:hypothetical protein